MVPSGVTRLQSVTRILARRRLAVARMQRLRERQRAGQQIAPTLYDNDILELLLDTNWLALADSEDRQQVGHAIYRMLKQAARARDA